VLDKAGLFEAFKASSCVRGDLASHRRDCDRRRFSDERSQLVVAFLHLSVAIGAVPPSYYCERDIGFAALFATSRLGFRLNVSTFWPATPGMPCPSVHELPAPPDASDRR
jgi:hypothetical protein